MGNFPDFCDPDLLFLNAHRHIMFNFAEQKKKRLGNSGFYSKKEEKLNVYSHGLGVVLSVVGFFLLLDKALEYDEFRLRLSFGIFGLSLILLYLASTLYHSATDRGRRHRLKIFDHVAIFILIAGSYTPFSLVTLQGFKGTLILIVSWSIALAGTILKLFFTGRYKILSTLMYVGMGWIIIFAINPLIENLSGAGLWWLFAGGVAYTMGAILYNINRIKFNHAIFHLFVLLGSFCHFMSIYLYVRPLSET